MAREKRVEEMPNLENMKIVTTPDEYRTEIPKETKKEIPADSTQRPVQGSAPVNCLRNERVVVRFVPSPNALVRSKGHVLSGGMAESAIKAFVVPKLSTGQYKNVLTNSEMAFLEETMGLEKGAMSIYRKTNNFWSDSNPDGIGKVILHKQDNYLDLSVPSDYIKYKILLANKDYICPNLQELEEHRKATYQFVIVSENAEAQMNLSKNDVKMECYMEYGAIRQDADTLRTILEILSGRPVAPNTKLDFLQGKVMEAIEQDARRFHKVIKDELLPAKVLIKRSVDAGLITTRNSLYYYDGQPMCEMGEDSVFDNAAKYISNIKRQELKYSLEARLKD